MAAETDDDVLLEDLWGDAPDDRGPRDDGADASDAVADAEDEYEDGHPDPAPDADADVDAEDVDADEVGDDEVGDDAADDGEPVVRRSRRSAGRRAALRRRRRRRAALRGIGSGILVVALAVGAVWAIRNLEFGGDEGAPVAEDAAPGAGEVQDPQPTAVLATFDEQDPNGAASQIIVLAWDRATEEATILLVPTGITTDVPGHGVARLGQSFALGAGPLLDASLDNLLTLDLDVAVGVSRQAWASLFTRVGGLTVEVPERLRERNDDGSATVRFAAGEQFLDGPRLAELLTFSAAGERELETLPRVQLVLIGLLDAIAGDPALLDAIFADGAPMLEVGSPEQDLPVLRTLFRELAVAHTRGDLVVRTLPVSPLGSGENDSYRIDETRAGQLVDDRLASSRPDVSSVDGGRRLEIRNGNGVPGMSSQVSQQLIPLGFRVLLTGNADAFDHEETRILVYEDAEEQLALARQIRDALGVGRIELSQVPQDVVDITVVVGRDYADLSG